ncbi:MAG: YjgP/YjgQ family permease [Bdellovibrionales bacterium]|jgi:lipopolysaccharide export system permease protein|nr:YjgP/YjgQ family permease [Bdellovibrionales bacterium]MBT3526035.1 YjgP/YjgQ family permease [Bdellovibrionales bacterium]MBT7669014.1 YjgP/YjgQ family permease [Bdellovibrionales bacterium]MBT7765827.1 YjgP/YjgQ family permease [Bdellovibrionales bacterium]
MPLSITKKLILKEWFRFFILSFIFLLLILTVAKLITGFLRSNVDHIEVLINYLIEMPTSFSRILPISCLVASLFSINKLKTRNELTAIFASGFSRKNYLITIFQASLIVALISLLNSSYLDPFVKKHRFSLLPDGASKFRNLKNVGLKASTIGSGRMWFKSHDYFFSFAAFDRINNRIQNISLYYTSANDNQYSSQKIIHAKSADHLKDRTWKFNGATILSGLNKEQFPAVSRQKELIVKMGETPDDFVQVEADITTLPTPKLIDYVLKLKASNINTASYEVLLYDKAVNALVCILFALLAASPIYRPNRRGTSFGFNLSVVFIFSILYWLVYSYTMELGKNSKLDPLIASFSVPIIFALYIAFTLFQHRKIR